MSEIKMKQQDKKVAKGQRLYFGKDMNGNIPAFPLGHVFISGRTGSGLDTFMNSLLLNLMENCNPNDIEVKLCFIGDSDSVWKSVIKDERRVPIFDEVKLIDTTEVAEQIQYLVKCLEDIVDLIRFRQRAVRFEVREDTVYVLKVSSCLTDHMVIETSIDANTVMGRINSALNVILSEGAGAGVYLINQYNEFVFNTEIVNKFDYKICLRSSAEVSRVLLGCDIAHTDNSEKNGICWVKSESNDVPIKLRFKFRPDTFIRKMIKAFRV